MWDVVRFINLVGCALVQGTYTFEMIVVVPALNTAPSQQSALIHRWLFNHLPNRYMPWCATAGGLSALALGLFSGDEITSTARVLYFIGVVFWVSTSVIVAGYSRPLDKQITEWVEADAVQAGEYAAIRRRWDRLIHLRAPLGLAGLCCFVIATLS